jgi:alkylhydroperoxidase/carboxymuconolactone decarboxylase family protein YurZ
MTDDRRTGEEILADVTAKRGYTLPYHRMFARHAPQLLARYDAYYETLTLKQRELTPTGRETVWAALQLAAREAHGSIHLKRGVKAGMGTPEFADAVAIAAAVEAWPALVYSSHHWAEWTPADATTARYFSMFEAARGNVPRDVAEITAVVCHAARRTLDAMQMHLPRAFAAGATAGQVCEGLSYVLMPCGGPTLIDAVDAWAEGAARDGYPGPW